MRLRRPEQGISLVEVLLGLATGAMVLLPLVSMLQTSVAAACITGTRSGLEREAAFALNRMAARIRATAPAQLGTQANTSSSAGWFAPVTFSRKGDTLVETQDGIDYTLAESVAGFSITAPPPEAGGQLIQVNLALRRADATASASATVRMGSAR